MKSNSPYLLEQKRSRLLFLLPGLCLYSCLIVLPALWSLGISFFKWDALTPMEFVGFQNYRYLFTQDYVFWGAVKNNAIWIVLALCFTVVLGLLFALLINRPFRGRTFLRAVLYFPYIVSSSIVAIIWIWVYHKQFGMYNGILELLNLSQFNKAWTADPNTALYAVFIADCWHAVGQPMVLFLAGLQTIPRDLLEAAYIDGAGRFRTFFHVTLPLLKETTFIVVATQITHALKVYDLIANMTGGGPANSTDTLATWMVTTSFSSHKFGAGAAISWLMTVIMMFIIIPYVLNVARDD